MKNFKQKLLSVSKVASTYLLYGIFLQIVLMNTLFGQNRTLTGTVTSEDGEGISGVTVIEKDTNNGTVTNITGQYAIEVPEGGTLIFSSVGYMTEEIKVDNRQVIDLVMTFNVQSLEEVVIIGYGSQSKETLTGSIVNIKGKTLEQNPAIRLSNSFAGRLPGVMALNRSGEPGSDVAQLLIRGSSTLGSSAPLIVIDGVPGREGFDQIDPRDVESVSVLKDASAAIYGARAANGVIIITTKRGISGKPAISYTFNQGITTPTRIPEFADAETLAKFQNDQLVAQGQAEKFSPEEIQKFRDGTDPLNYPNTNWAESTLKDFSTQSRHSLSIRGGTDVVKYFVSGNYANQEGIFKNGIHNYNVLGVRSNIDANITENFRLSLDLSSQDQNRVLPSQSTNDIVQRIWRNYSTSHAFFPNGLPGQGFSGTGDNPAVMVTDVPGYNKNKTNLYQTKLSFDLNIPQVEGLGMDGFVSFDKTNDYNKRFRKPFSAYSYDADTETYQEGLGGGVSTPELSERYNFRSSLIANAKIKYARFSGNHRFESFIAMELADNKTNYFSAHRRDFISPAIDQLYAGGEGNQVTDGSASEFTRRNYFGRLSYGFKDRYLIDFNVRYDGSSAFPEDSRWGFFPGISLGWIASEEAFIRDNLNFVDHLKIRGSWGKMGNDAIDPFQYLATYSFTTGYFLGEGRNLKKGLTQNVVPNPNITWEVANTRNIGLDAELGGGLFGLTLDVFKTRRSNILIARNASIPVYTGLQLPLENIGIVENKGFEIELRHTNSVGDLTYSIRPNISFARNKIIDIDEPENVEEYQRRTGHPMGTNLYYIPLGIYRSQQQIDNSPHVPGTIVNDLQYQDTNGDGEIDNRDRMRLDKTSTPEIIFGTQISVGYRNFDLGILFQGQTNAWRYYWLPQGLFGNVLKEMADNRPTLDNPDSKYPNLTYDNSQVSALDSEFWLKDASFIRLKNVELGYTLPGSVSEKIGIAGLRIYVNGFNIFTIDKLKWFDPEGDADRGAFYPQNKIWNMGLNLTF